MVVDKVWGLGVCRLHVGPTALFHLAVLGKLEGHARPRFHFHRHWTWTWTATTTRTTTILDTGNDNGCFWILADFLDYNISHLLDQTLVDRATTGLRTFY